MRDSSSAEEDRADLVVVKELDGTFTVLKNRYGVNNVVVDSAALLAFMSDHPTCSVAWRKPEVRNEQANLIEASEAQRKQDIRATVDARIEEALEDFKTSCRTNLRDELEVFVEQRTKDLDVRIGQIVAEQVAGLARKADREAEIERLNFFAARAMEALMRNQLMPMSDGVRKQIAHQAYEMARAMIDQSKRVVKGP